MGGFWSDIAKQSHGQEAVGTWPGQDAAAPAAAGGGAERVGVRQRPGRRSRQVRHWEDALCKTNTSAIKDAQQQAAQFNTNGDSSKFTPGTSADSKQARTIANYAFWDMFS